MHSSRWDIISEHLSTIDALEIKWYSCQFVIIKHQYTGNQSIKLYPQREGGPSSLKFGHIKPVYKVAVDNFEIRVRGQTWYSRGKTVALAMILGGNIFMTMPNW